MLRKYIGLFGLMVLLAGCGNGEVYLKKAILELDVEFAEDLKKYAEFTDSQQQEVDAISKGLADWIRQNQLSPVRDSIQVVVEQLRQGEQVTEGQIHEMLDNLGNVFSFAEANDALAQMASFAKGLSDQQVVQIDAALQKENSKARKELAKWTLPGENKELVQQLSFLLRDLGLRPSKAQKQRMKEVLAARKPLSPLQAEAEIVWNNELIALLQQRESTNFEPLFIQHWRGAYEAIEGVDTNMLQHNQQLVVEVVHSAINGLKPADRDNLVNRLEDYLAVFDQVVAPPLACASNC